MTIPKIKKGWIITIVPLVVMMVLNPSFTSFKEYSNDYRNKNRVVVQKRVSNYLLFSVYEKQVLDLSNGNDNPTVKEDEKYLGFALNFFDITKQNIVPTATVAANSEVDAPIVDTIKKSSKIIGYTQDDLPILDTSKKIQTTVSIKEHNPFDDIPDSVIFGNNSCNPNKTKKDFISYMKEYYPDWKVAGNPTINDKKGHIYEVKFTALNPHDGYKKELIVAKIEYDDKGEKYGFSTIKGSLY